MRLRALPTSRTTAWPASENGMGSAARPQILKNAQRGGCQYVQLRQNRFEPPGYICYSHVSLLVYRRRTLNQTTQLSDSSKFITFDTPCPAMAFTAVPAGRFSANLSRFRV